VVGESQSEPGCRSGIRLEGQVEADQSPVSGQRKHAADAKEGPTDVTSLATLQRHMLAANSSCQRRDRHPGQMRQHAARRTPQASRGRGGRAGTT
jgi:hypothetical protein